MEPPPESGGPRACMSVPGPRHTRPRGSSVWPRWQCPTSLCGHWPRFRWQLANELQTHPGKKEKRKRKPYILIDQCNSEILFKLRNPLPRPSLPAPGLRAHSLASGQHQCSDHIASWAMSPFPGRCLASPRPTSRPPYSPPVEDHWPPAYQEVRAFFLWENRRGARPQNKQLLNTECLLHLPAQVEGC